MAILRNNEIKELSANDMKAKITELRREVMSERAKIASGGAPDNPGKLREIKKVIARILTIAGEKGYKIDE